jgi:uncharacterized membrane protein
MKISAKKVIWVAALIGAIDAAYLTYVKLTHIPIYCTPGLGDCASVQNSRWSTIWGIPLSLFGFAMYLAIIGLLLFGPKIKLIKPYSNYLLFGIGLFGFLYSLYLTYLEFFVIHALCQWCILSAICITGIFISSIVQLQNNQFQSSK